MNRRERLEAKLAKRKQWAQSRKAKSEQAWKQQNAVPLPYGGEPIKVGHHSEKRHRAAIAKAHALAFKAIEHTDMASHHESKASGLEDQLSGSIFSDDADAVEALEQRISEREAERERIKAYNRSCRGGAPDLALLDQKQQADIVSTCKINGRELGQFPPYVLSNLGGRIKTDRDRLKRIKAQAERASKAEQAGGVHIATGRGYAVVTFAEKPDRSTISALKSAGFRWGGGSWRGRAENMPAEVVEMAKAVQA